MSEFWSMTLGILNLVLCRYRLSFIHYMYFEMFEQQRFLVYSIRIFLLCEKGSEIVIMMISEANVYKNQNLMTKSLKYLQNIFLFSKFIELFSTKLRTCKLPVYVCNLIRKSSYVNYHLRRGFRGTGPRT